MQTTTRKIHWLAVLATLAWMGGNALLAQETTTRITFDNLPFPERTNLTNELEHLGIVFSDDDTGLDPDFPCSALRPQENLVQQGTLFNLFRLRFVTDAPVTHVTVEFSDHNGNEQIHGLYQLDEDLQIVQADFFQDTGSRLDDFALQLDDPEGIAEIAACEQPYGAERLLAITFTTASANQRPECATAAANPVLIWPPNGKMVPISIADVTDPDGDPVSVTITGITQDEPLSGRRPDATGVGTSTARVRATRAGGGDGRVYHLSFTATDPQGASCTGTVAVCVPHDRRPGAACGDGGGIIDSLGGSGSR